MAKETSYIQSPMSQAGEGSSPLPSGSVTTDGDTSTRDLPRRTGGRIPEVTYDHNVALPGRLSSEGGK